MSQCQSQLTGPLNATLAKLFAIAKYFVKSSFFSQLGHAEVLGSDGDTVPCNLSLGPSWRAESDAEPRERSGPQAIERNPENPVDLLGVGGADCGDAADHLGDVGDVGVGADYAGVLGSFE